jgi:hypothetical protein
LESEQEYERVNSSLIHNFNSSEKHTRSSRQVNPDHQSFKTQVGHLSDIEYSSGLNHTPTPELDNTGEVEQENMKNEEKEEESHVYEVQKKTILLLKEDEIKPIAPSYKHFHEKIRRSKLTLTLEINQSSVLQHQNEAAQCYSFMKKERDAIPLNNARCKQIPIEGICGDHKKQKRRISSIEYRPISTLSVVKEEERERRISTGTHYELGHLSLGKKYHKTHLLNIGGSTSNIFFPSSPSLSSSSIAASSLDKQENQPQSPPEYLNFHEESDSVDEFFLLSEDVLNVDFDTVCQELARFSADMETILENTGQNLSCLKAAKASEEWNTLWIFRGV